MDFGALPPEINSGRMYSGPGPAPMLAAATAWDALATELHTAAVGYEEVTSTLTGGSWRGPAAASMLAATSPHVAWLHTTAVQAQESANRARAAAGAYEAARAMTVPPSVVAANRALLMSLVATNVLGQNTPAIAATEAHYGAMWAQDAAAMYAYAGESVAVTRVTPFTPPPETTNPAGLVGQGVAAGEASGSSAVNDGARLMSAVPQLLQGFASSPAALATSPLEPLDPLIEYTTAASSHVRTLASSLSFLTGAAALAWSINRAGEAGAAALPAIAPGTGALLATGIPGSTAAAGGSVLAGMGRTSTIGGMSVPQTWFGAVPAASTAVAALPGAGVNGGSVVAPAGIPILPVGASTGRSSSRLAADAARFLERPAMVLRWPVGG